MVLPALFGAQLAAYVPVRHGREGETAKHGWIEPDGVDPDRLQLAYRQGGECTLEAGQSLIDQD